MLEHQTVSAKGVKGLLARVQLEGGISGSSPAPDQRDSQQSDDQSARKASQSGSGRKGTSAGSPLSDTPSGVSTRSPSSATDSPNR